MSPQHVGRVRFEFIDESFLHYVRALGALVRGRPTGWDTSVNRQAALRGLLLGMPGPQGPRPLFHAGHGSRLFMQPAP